MKMVDLLTSIPVPISNEENRLLSKIRIKESTDKQELDEREQELARQLVYKGVLDRIEENEIVKYIYNDFKNLRRE